MNPIKHPNRPPATAGVLRVVLVYAVFASAWIFLSDTVLYAVFQDTGRLKEFSVIKGAGFVVVTAVLLYLMIRRLMTRLRIAGEREADLMEEQGRTLHLLQTLLESLPEAVYFKDAQGVYRLSNAQHARWVGRPSAQIVGLTDDQLFDRETAAGFLTDDWQAVGDGSAWMQNGWVTRAETGEKRFVQSSKTLLRSADGCPQGVLGVMRDVTELHESRERFRSLYEDSRLPVVIVDPQSVRFLDCNRAAAAIFGLPDVAAVRGRTPADLSAPTQYDGRPSALALVEHVRQVLDGGDHTFVWRHQRPDGTLWDAEVHAMPLELRGQTVHQVTLRDITQIKQQEAEMLRTVKLLSMAERAANAGAWSWDVVHDKHHWTPQLLRLFGLAPEDYPQDDFDAFAAWRKVLHPADREEAEARFRACITSRRPFKHSYRIVRPSGEIRWIDARGAVTFDSLGEPQEYSGLCIDATDRKAAEAELEHYRNHLEELVEARTAELRHMEQRAQLLLDSAASGLIGTDKDGRTVFANPAACRMLGYTAEEMHGRDLHALIHHHHSDGRPYPVGQCPNFRARQDGKVVRTDDDVYWHRDGHAIPVISECHPMFEDGRISGAVVSFVDVTVLRAAAEAREQALVAAERLSRMRQEFLDNMSHELRTPLNGVLGFAQIGLRHIDKPEKCATAFARIRASGEQVLALVNDILSFSRLESGKLTAAREAFSPRDLTGRTVAALKAQAEAKGLSLSCSIAPAVPTLCIGTPARLGRVLRELLGNAIKFTPRGRIDLSVGREDDWLVFRVTDTGPGIAEARLHEIFEPFHQLDGTSTRPVGGTGLGLAIAKRLAELMHGGIHVDSQPGRGCVFELRVPCELPGNGEAPVDGDVPGLALSGRSILVVEDEPLDQSVIANLLIEYGASVVLAGSGEQAVQRVLDDGAAAFDLVLMDLGLPGIDGYQAARRLQALAPDLPVVALTAHDTDADRERCRQAGLAGFVVKPIDAGTLIRTILLEQRSRNSAPGRDTRPAEIDCGPDDDASRSALLAELLARLRDDDFVSARLLDEHEAALRAVLGDDYSPIAEATHAYDFLQALTRLEAALRAKGFAI